MEDLAATKKLALLLVVFATGISWLLYFTSPLSKLVDYNTYLNLSALQDAVALILVATLLPLRLFVLRKALERPGPDVGRAGTIGLVGRGLAIGIVLATVSIDVAIVYAIVFH